MLYLKMTLLIFALCVSCGCANMAMDRAVGSWQGQPVSAVVAAWGKPSEELKVSGKHLLLWNTYHAGPASPDRNEPSCVRLLELDRSGRVVSGTWDGSDCPGWFSGWRR
jgi:hypothetical protein